MNTGDFRVLIIEDDVLIALDLEDLLTDFGYTVCGTARSEREALEMAGALKPRLALTDICLADGSSGIDAACRLRDEFAIPSVFLSANADQASARRAQPLAYVRKPFQEIGLRQTLADAARLCAIA